MGSLSEKMKGAPGRPVLMGASFLTALFNTVALLAIARNAGPEMLGTLGFALAFMGLFLFVGDLGYGFAFERLLARGFQFNKCYRAFLMAKVKLTVSMAILSGVLIAVYSYFLAPDGHTALHPIALVMILGYFIMVNLAGIWVLSMRLRGRKPMPNDLLESFVKAIMVLGLFWFINPRNDQELIFWLAFIYLIAATLGMMLIRNNARSLRMGEDDEEVEVEFQDVSRRFMPYIVLIGFSLNIDKIALWLVTDFHTLGIYFGAQRITIFIAASAVMIEVLMGSAISVYIKENRTREISDTLRMTERYVSLVILPVTAFYVFFSNSLLMAFLGERFADGGLVVELLAGAGLFAGLASPHVSYLLRADRFREMTMTAGAGLLAMLATLGLLLPDLFLPDSDIHGMNGAAMAVLASSVTVYITTRYLTWKLLECRPHKRIPVHFLCAGLMMAVMQFVVWYFEIDINFPWLIALAILGFFTYVMCLYLTGEMVRRDFNQFKTLTKPE
jgi:O-antigen/teichoic acid export membrane protein